VIFKNQAVQLLVISSCHVFNIEYLNLIRKTKIYKPMKKKIFTIISLLMTAKLSFATVVITDLNYTLNAANSVVKLDVTGDEAFDLTFNFF
jgi:hypothetical protein